MNIKRIAITAVAAGGLMLGTALPAFALDDLTINNFGRVRSRVATHANTGFNSINAGEDVDGGSVSSGAATSSADVVNSVNYTEVCACPEDGVDDVNITNDGRVRSSVRTRSNSGFNSINASDDVSNGSIVSGDASSTSIVWNDVNTTILGVGSTAPAE